MGVFGRGDGRTHDLLVPRRNKLRFEPFPQAERACALRCCSSSLKILRCKIFREPLNILGSRRKRSWDTNNIQGMAWTNVHAIPWSRRRDLNPRPLGPEPSALPNCATPRRRRGLRSEPFPQAARAILLRHGSSSLKILHCNIFREPCFAANAIFATTNLPHHYSKPCAAWQAIFAHPFRILLKTSFRISPDWQQLCSDTSRNNNFGKFYTRKGQISTKNPPLNLLISTYWNLMDNLRRILYNSTWLNLGFRT